MLTKLMYPLIAVSSSKANYLLCRGFNTVFQIPNDAYIWLVNKSTSNDFFSEQFINLCESTWGIDIRELRVSEAVYFRSPAVLNYTDASYELNLACNYRCAHCYLDEKFNKKLNMAMRKKILHSICQSGVLRLHITGGEPLIDKHFFDTYRLIHELGLLVRISTNGYALYKPEVLKLLSELPPTRISISLYGATRETYENLTNTNGQETFKKFIISLSAAATAKLPVRLKIVLTRHNENELEEMKALANDFGFESYVFGRLSPTLKKDKNVLNHQARGVDLRAVRQSFSGCNAGKTFFHVNPLGKASICMSGRTPNIDFLQEGTNGLRELSNIASSLLEKSEECASCSIVNSCATCPVMVKSYNEAGADRAFFCQF